MCDETWGNGYWRFLFCLFLSVFHRHTHTGKKKDLWTPTTCTTCSVWACISCHWPSKPPLLFSLPPAMQTQSASGHTAHLLILPLRIIYCSCAIRDQRSQIRVSHEYTPVFWSAEEEKSERCEVGGRMCKSNAWIFVVKNVPCNKYGFAMMASCISAPHWNVSTTVSSTNLLVQHNPSSCHTALYPCIHHIL